MSAAIILKRARWMANVALVWVLTWLTGAPFLNFLDLHLTPASSLKTSSRSGVGRFSINSTDISTRISTLLIRN
ncbi:hypothetical protein H4582DRAFT_1996364, partial [Lactarius indigo]